MSKVYRYGCGEFKVKSRYAEFSYCGNMSSRLAVEVRESFDNIFAKGSFDKFVEVANITHADPAYIWSGRISLKDYKAYFAPLLSVEGLEI